jgi:hypothetical protein
MKRTLFDAGNLPYKVIKDFGNYGVVIAQFASVEDCKAYMAHTDYFAYDPDLWNLKNVIYVEEARELGLID